MTVSKEDEESLPWRAEPSQGRAPQGVGPGMAWGTQPPEELELAQGRQHRPPLITLQTLPAHLPPPSVSPGEAGEEDALCCQWLQRLLIKASGMEALCFKSLKTVSKKKKNVDRTRRGAECSGLQPAKARCRKQINSTLSTREQGDAAKRGRGGDSLVCLPLFSPKNTRYEFHGNRWWDESVTFTRSPFSNYNHRFSKSGLLPVLVPLSDKFLLDCCCSVAQLCLTLCDPMDYSTPGFPGHYLWQFAQTHVRSRVSYAIPPSHPLSLPSPPALNLSQHQGLFQWVSSLHLIPAQMSPLLWSLPGLPQVEPMTLSPMFPRPSSILSKGIDCHLAMFCLPEWTGSSRG